MFLSNLLKRIREKSQRKTILKELIESLRIDETQRFLYLESLELLDENGMTAFYNRLVAFVDETEGFEILADGQRRSGFVRELRSNEEMERSKEVDNANFLFDNV
ncbi:MAG: hypothetical protein QG650_189 [Patescibacteria group bacterium]|nr:hypothetical protein [Patescibacteria group bacterium]